MVVDVEAMAADARRRALVVVLRANRAWTLEQVLAGDLHHEQLASLTVRELCGYDSRSETGLPPLPRTRYERATSLHGEDFDALVFDLLRELKRPVRPRYLRARLGGSARWKLYGALRRLCADGLVLRAGITSDTTYQASGREGGNDP